MQSTVRWLGALIAALLLLTSSAIAQDTDPAARALAVYAEGKRLYDAGDYLGARAKFIDAIKLEPANARWYYNLGLAHRQVDNFQAARQALLRARELNPEYKRAEIDQKLASMGFDPAVGAEVSLPSRQATRGADEDGEESSLSGWLLVLGPLAGMAGVIWLIRRRFRAAGGAEDLAPRDSGMLTAAGSRIDAAAGRLVQVEHAMRLGEHADLRSQLDHASRLEQSARKLLDLAAGGDAKTRRKLEKLIGELEASSARAGELAASIHGAEAFTGQGERVACYFCARPLANADYRHAVAMKQADATVDVVACPNCAALAARGEAPTILTGNDGRTHWSELPGFDPYAARHAVADQTQHMPAWKFAPRRSFGELALLAGGAALAGGALAAMLRPENQTDSTPLDLDAARESGLAQEAARAAAQHASGQRRERFSDHS